MTVESSQDLRARLDAITARIKRGEHTAEDVAWLRDVAEQYVVNWERAIAKLRRRARDKTSTNWDAAAARPKRGALAADDQRVGAVRASFGSFAM